MACQLGIFAISRKKVLKALRFTFGTGIGNISHYIFVIGQRSTFITGSPLKLEILIGFEARSISLQMRAHDSLMTLFRRLAYDDLARDGPGELSTHYQWKF
jgi:hypothetical protein